MNIKKSSRVSMLDAQIWVCKIKKKNMLQFEYKDLPKELQDRALLHRARAEGLIISIGKNGNGRNLWRISDNIKCKEDENGNENIEEKKIDRNNIYRGTTRISNPDIKSEGLHMQN